MAGKKRDEGHYPAMLKVPTYPVRLRGSPLYLVDLPLGSGVSQDWVLDSPRHLLDVPNQGLDMEEEGMIRNNIIIDTNICVNPCLSGDRPQQCRFL